MLLMSSWLSLRLPARRLPARRLRALGPSLLLLAAALALGALPLRASAQDDGGARADTTRSYVELRSGERLYGRIAKQRGLFREDVFVVGTETVPHDSVRAYRTPEGYFVRAEGGSWAERVRTGRIDTYVVRKDLGPDERLPERERPPAKVGYFGVGDGPVRKVTRAHLAPVVGAHPPSAALIQRHRRLTIAQWGVLGVGVGTSAAGFALHGEDGVPVVGLAGLGVAMLAYVPYALRQGTLREAIRRFNAQ
jgi:hypothetical protein